MISNYSWRKISSLNLVIAGFIFLLILPTLSYGSSFRITIIPSSDSFAYITAVNHVKTTIRNLNNNSIQLNVKRIKDLNLNNSSSSKFPDLYVPVGQLALKEILKYSGNTPILSSLTSESDFTEILKHSSKSNDSGHIGAVYLNQPIKRNIQFARLVLPKSNNFGFIVSKNNETTINAINSLTMKDNYHIEIVNPRDNVITSLSRMLDIVDAVIALPDPIIFNLRTTRNILLSTYRKRVPIIGFSKSYTKAGAIASIYTTPENVGKQTGEYISRIINKKIKLTSGNSLPRLHAKYFSISINERVAKSLGFPNLNAVNIEKSLLRIEGGNYE